MRSLTEQNILFQNKRMRLFRKFQQKACTYIRSFTVIQKRLIVDF